MNYNVQHFILRQSKVSYLLNINRNLYLSLGDSSIIVALYEYMHTVDVTDSSGRTPLHYAAIVGNEETLTTLLLCNPDVNRMSKDGTTPLHESIIHNHPRMSKIIYL
jgi:ankyrin repeat protein